MYKLVDGHYRSMVVKKNLLACVFPTFTFYISLLFIVFKASRVARRGRYCDSEWVAGSEEVLQALENIGVSVNVSGLNNLDSIDGPIIVVGNHMSMMETLVLPGFVQPIKAITFVVKESLLTYPVFKHIMRSRNPVAVTRTNPRQDLKTVMGAGCERLNKGISIVVFPQTTRSHNFDPNQMSSIGVKLAKKAGVPVIPLALKTDCWENGTWFKDFGRINPSKKAYFAFGEPIMVEGKGDAEQSVVNDFIEGKLKEWAKPV